MSAFTNKARHKLIKSHNHSLTQLRQKRRKKFKELEKLYKKKPEEEPEDGGKAARQVITDTFNGLENELMDKNTKELADFDAGMEAAEAKEAKEKAKADGSNNNNNNGMGNMSLGETSEGGTTQKLSRYEKRKQKKLAEEAKIDAARAAIEANQDDQKEVEMSKILEVLEPLGFTIKDIKADGHCLFTSVAHQLALRSGEQLTNQACFEMRKIATSYMRSNPDSFAPFIEGDLSEYCDNMSNTASWGGQIEIQALSDALQTPVEVYAAGQDVLIMGQTYENVPLRVTYHRKYYTLGEHYNSVVPISMT
jgi:OTU domain-containing protein 6